MSTERRTRVAGPLSLKPLYSLPELAKAARLSRGRLLRLFRHLGVRMMRSGTFWLVPLTELEDKARPFWESVQATEAMRCTDDDRE
jgi:hypothetical protein